MLPFKFFLIVIADLMFVASFALVINDVWMKLGGNEEAGSECAARTGWKQGIVIGALAWVPLLLAMAVARFAS